MDDLYRGRLTPGGRALVWSCLAATIMMLGGLSLPLLYCFFFCLSTLLLSVVAAIPFGPKLVLRRHITAFPSMGDELTYRVTVENVGQRLVRNVAIEERGLPPELRPVGEAPIIPLLAPGERATVTLRLLCTLRGAYELAWLQGATCFPAGFFKWGKKVRQGDRLLVYPRFTPLADFEIPVGRNYQPGGIAVASQVGESTEFFGTRDWREGDRVRDLHWPSSARTGTLIVKEFHEEYFIRLAMVLDVEVLKRGLQMQLESALSLAAGIADVLAKREYIIDLFAAGPQVYHFQAGRALAHFDNILEILACIEGGGRLDMEALEAALIPEAPRLSAVVLIMMDWEPKRAGLVRLLKSHGIAVRVLCMRRDRSPQDDLSPDELVEAS
jgi:uncharacterized repeat protein (TIGR01451 family)